MSAAASSSAGVQARKSRLLLRSQQLPPAAVAISPFKRAAPGVAPRAAAPLGDEKKRDVVRQGFEKKVGLGKCIAEELESGILKVACPKGQPLAEGSDQYKEYRAQYKRLSTHLRQNKSLAKRLKSGELAAAGMAAMADRDLMADSQREEIQQHVQDGLKEALGEKAEDTSHWTPSKDYICPHCESGDCLYIQNFSNAHGYDDKDVDAAITIRCKECRHLWKEGSVEGGRMAAGAEGAQVGRGELLATSAEAPEIWNNRGLKNLKKPTWELPA